MFAPTKRYSASSLSPKTIRHRRCKIPGWPLNSGVTFPTPWHHRCSLVRQSELPIIIRWDEQHVCCGGKSWLFVPCMCGSDPERGASACDLGHTTLPERSRSFKQKSLKFMAANTGECTGWCDLRLNETVPSRKLLMGLQRLLNVSNKFQFY